MLIFSFFVGLYIQQPRGGRLFHLRISQNDLEKTIICKYNVYIHPFISYYYYLETENEFAKTLECK
jgi:hypothetical protein